MLFERRFRQGIAEGTITMTFRRWRTRQAIVGHRYRTSAGMIEVDAVDRVEPEDVTDVDARRSGYPAATALLDDLRGDHDVPITRVTFHLVTEPDPRDVLARHDRLSDGDVAVIDRRLDLMDARSGAGSWTRATLQAIARSPGVRAADLATSLGRETQSFKRDVRKLKELGLTTSLEIGYRLSPRGDAYLRASRR